MAGSYNWVLVFASYCVAVIAAYTAIYFGARVFDLTGRARKFWLAAGALCLGTGIWSMHFVGMSAYTMPGHAHMSFSIWLTIASWIPAVLASALALYVITLPEVSARSVTASAFIMGAGIFAMHYGGMYAMQMHPQVQYDAVLVVVSGVIAVVASGAALVICRKVRDLSHSYALVAKLLAALIMGAAICGMHYTGMAAATYPSGAEAAADNLLRGDWMGIPTAIVASLFLLLAVYFAYHDLRAIEKAREAHRDRQEAARRAAFHDSVTGLANRSYLESSVLEKLTQRDGDLAPSPFGLLYFELDNYRELSYSGGEEMVQSLMRSFAAELQQYLPAAELLVRYSTNSFIAIVPALGAAERAVLVRPLINRLAKATVINQQKIPCSWGVGFSEYPQSGSNSRNLIRAAQKIRQRFGAQQEREELQIA